MINFSRRQLARYAVDEMLGGTATPALARQLAAGLIVSGRQKQADLLLADIDQELEDRQLVAKAQITTAHQLSAALHQELAGQIKRRTGAKRVDISAAIDKSVIGGVKIETANRTWDKTTRRLLGELETGV